MNNLNRLLAKRFLFSKRSGRFLPVSTGIAILGLAFGVAALTICLSVTSGFLKEYKKAILSFNSHLIVMKADEIENPEPLMQEIVKTQKATSVVGWTPFVYREGMAIAGSRVKGIVLKGIDFQRYSSLSKMKINFDESVSDKNVEHLPVLILGKQLAEELAPKDRILRILFPQGLKPERAGVKNVKRFFVAGTFESGLYEYDSSFAFLSLADAQRFFQTEGRVSGIEIWLKDPDESFGWAETLKKKYSFPYVIMTWRDLNENVFRAVEIEKFLFSLLMTVLIAVASLNVLGALTMLLIEKRRSVAILRAMGSSWNSLRKVFLFDGLLIGCAGIGLGFFLGMMVLWTIKNVCPIPLAAEVYFVNQVPVAFGWNQFFWVVTSTLLILFVGCELSLRGLIRLQVTQALQGE